MFAKRVENAVRICRDARRRQGQYGTKGSIHAFAWEIFNKSPGHLGLSDIQ